MIGAPRRAVCSGPCLALSILSGTVAVDPATPCELLVLLGVRAGIEVAREDGRQGASTPRLDKSRDLLGLTFPHRIAHPAGRGWTCRRPEGRRQAGVLETAGEGRPVTV